MNFQRLFVRYTARPHQQLLALVAFAIFSITFVSPCLAATDVYVVFSGSESNALKKAVSASLKKALKVKTYNVDMLALADYSGKQKVIAKFSRATVVVFLGDRPLNELKGASFGAHMVITSGAGDDLSTDKIKVYAISKGRILLPSHREVLSCRCRRHRLSLAI
jgi:hypothetical protein